MISKARLKHVFMGMLAVILAFSTTSLAYAETTSGVEVVSEQSQVTVHVFNNSNLTPNTEGSGEEIANPEKTLGTAIGGATLSYYKVGELVQYTLNGSTSLKYAVSKDTATVFGWSLSGKTEVTINNGTADAQYYLLDASELSSLLDNTVSSDLRGKGENGNWSDITTNDDGLASTPGTLSGVYLFVGKSMPSQVTTEVAPFFVSAPMPADGGWNTGIHVYPKVQTAGEISISKEVRYASSQDESDFKQSMSADAGTPLEYRVTVTIPGDVKNLSSFSITDGLDNSLAVYDASNVEVKVEGAVQLAKDDDYKLQPNAAAVRFELTSDGLNKFSTIQSGTTTITITYETKIINTAPLAAAIGQPARLAYRFNSASTENSAESTANVYTYGIDLTKTFEDATAYPTNGKTQFSLYTDQDCMNVVAVSSSDGSYWVDSSSSTTAMDVAQIETTPDGTLTIKGLAAGTYYLKEVAAPGGYGKLQEPIEIKIAEGSGDPAEAIQKPVAYVNDVSATINEGTVADRPGLVQLTVENQKMLFGFLPKTGDVGTFIFIAAGIGLVCAAVVYLTSRRRKNITNSH